jgi:pSer/pThr/pTyr-binding forkhead associated (FHA) protein
MQVKLKVTQGVQAGREVILPIGRFLIGRGEECHLRPRSEAVSRQHCEIRVTENQVVVRDLGSKNGVFVNDKQLTEDCVVQQGDKLQVGPLLFEFAIDHSLGAKRPAARDVKEVAARTAASSSDDLDVTRWLEEGDDSEIARQVATPDTRQFRLDDTGNVALDTNVAEDGEVQEQQGEESKTDKEESKKSDRWKKEKPGKLPTQPKSTAKDSREAAADMLKRFFNRR